jgi:beta-glucosidase-like glycosyl hydrolase
MAASVVKGLQGSGDFLKVAATCKHFFGYSLELAEGHSQYSFDAKIAPQDLADTYLPAFEACVRASKAAGVMCAYNAADGGVPQCANGPRMQGLLRGKWGFDGYVVSDCNAVAAFVWGHRTSPDDAHALGSAVKAGTDVLCDNMDTERAAASALQSGLLTEADINAALERTYAIRFRTGQFEPPGSLPWAGLGLDVVNSDAHRALAREAAVKGIVLLKNDAPPPPGGSKGGGKQQGGGGAPALLPLDKSKLKKVCVVGPLADSPEHLMGNYYGVWDKKLTASPLAAVREALKGTAAVVTTDNAFKIMGANYYDWPLESALEACRGADVALVFAGGSMTAKGPVSEGEGIDREGLELPGRQADLIRALAERNPGTPVALVLIAGGPVDVAWPQAAPNVPSILMAGFPGQEGGRAVADVLFGAAAPSGRLPVTWPYANFTRATPITDMGLRPDPSRGYPGRCARGAVVGGCGGGYFAAACCPTLCVVVVACALCALIVVLTSSLTHPLFL